MTYQIIKNAALIAHKYPLREMEIFDAFDVPAGKCLSARTSAAKYGTQAGKKFTVRKFGDAYRCQRLA